MPCLRHTSATFIPASCSCRTPMICSSVNRLRFIRPSPSGLRTLPQPGGVFRAHVKFSGVLVSDFYAAYSAIECRQQKCLIHFIRDLNDELLKYPYNDRL